jgi:PAS domain S-box-containing protein
VSTPPENASGALPPSAVTALLDRAFIASLTDARGIIRYVNNLFCSVSEYTREELIGKPHRIVRSGLHSREFFKSMWDTIKGGNVWHGEICNRAKSGRLYWVDSFIMPFSSEDGPGFFSIRYDITRLKEIEATVESQDALIDIKRKRLGQIAFLIAHEMRPPVANLLGLADALEAGNLSAEETARILESIRSEARRSDELLRKMMQSAVVSDAIDGAANWSSGR